MVQQIALQVQWDHEEADTKIFAHIKFLCENIRLNRIVIVSPDNDVTGISYIKVLLTLATSLDAILF